MNGFLRAFRGELYLYTHRRSVRRAHLLVAIVAIVHVLGWMLILKGQASVDDLAPELVEGWNFWPRFAASCRAALYLVELLVIALVAGSFPSEIKHGVTRDPVTRGISRGAYAAARGCSAVLLPASLYVVAVVCSAMTAWIFFDAGPLLDQDGTVHMDEAAIMQPVVLAVLHGLPAMLALSGFACLLSVVFQRGVVAAAAGVGVLLGTDMFHEALGDAAPLWFADTLPGFGPDSFLEQAAGFARGLQNYYPESFDAVVATGWWAPLPVFVLSFYVTILVFRRRAL